MIVDASVWVARFLADDRHHGIAMACITALLECESRLVIPVLAWPEVAGAIARRTGVAANGHDAVSIIRALRLIESIPMDQSLAHEAAKIAGSRKLRGADAVYVALAVTHRMPLVTLDSEMLERARGVAEVFTPEQWLQKR
ncbi:type II toxin-antitoxin system VapC family toxin [Sulfuritalea sp.]|uniref:type II toxin-antitoxin system VapC family toxin n=1 Tax=Sulfuritalea sp. TaxID=2480090 RepID=UPI00286DD731|nr:type II toxin-antitoxin system VapC family toxin [Sulfuritalea sp.]